ncbi:MAG: hypothetical protein K2G70_02285 [Turicibacter sp.]|nr:hypothetical protein [Turicibacter sp.]
MKHVEACEFLSRDYIEGRIREAFKKNEYCQLFELSCKYPKEAIQFTPYQTLKTRLKERIKEDIRHQVLERFQVESIEHLPFEYVESLEHFINDEYAPSKAINKRIYHLSLFYDSIRLRTGLRLDESSVKGDYKRELSFSDHLKRIIDDEF